MILPRDLIDLCYILRKRPISDKHRQVAIMTYLANELVEESLRDGETMRVPVECSDLSERMELLDICGRCLSIDRRADRGFTYRSAA